MGHRKPWTGFAVLATLAAAAPAGAEDIVKLRRGYYVRADVACERASNATLSLFTGKSFGALCKVDAVQTTPRGTQISQTCRDRGYVAQASQLYRITSDHDYVIALDGEDIAYRLCPQSELPPPWSATDLSALLRCSDTE